jgi:hypothetical protein
MFRVGSGPEYDSVDYGGKIGGRKEIVAVRTAAAVTGGSVLAARRPVLSATSVQRIAPSEGTRCEILKPSDLLCFGFNTVMV